MFACYLLLAISLRIGSLSAYTRHSLFDQARMRSAFAGVSPVIHANSPAEYLVAKTNVRNASPKPAPAMSCDPRFCFAAIP
jgi:hypothetical protein